MPTNPSLQLYSRKTLDQITKVPKDIISVYVVEQHIWSNKGNGEERHTSRMNRVAESQTVQEFLIDPVRPFLMEIFRLLSAPYDSSRKDQPIGQGYWIQAEFGSGKSHLLSFIGALALGGQKEWNIIKEKEEKSGKGKRESLYYYYENGLAKKTNESKGVLVAVKTLVGQGDNNSGLVGADKTLADYVLDAVGEAYYAENGRSLPLFPPEILAERFIQNDLERYSNDLEKYLKDPRYYDEDERESLSEFLEDLRNNHDPKIQQDRGQKLWNFYRDYLKVTPDIPLDSEPKLDHMIKRLLEEGYAGLLLILDEVSLYMKGRTESQKAEDEKVLVVLSNRLAKVNNRPIWTVCSAQQAIESKGGVRNIIADDRLKLIPLLNHEGDYYDIALSRVREITDPSAIDQYYEDYKRSFSWPQNQGKDEFARFFPYYKPSIDIVRAVSYKLTTIRSALSFMLETIKAMRIKKSNELITHWTLFDDVVNYSEDPSGTNRGITAIKTKFTDDWKAYEEACKQIDNSTNPLIRTYRNRCVKIVKTLFLYHIASLAPDGLTSEELMNAVMEWKDHDMDRRVDLQDNKDHYENLIDKLDLELLQIEKRPGGRFRFQPQGIIDIQTIFQRAREQAGQNSIILKQAWAQLLALDGWSISTNFMTIDLAHGMKSVFREIAPESSKDVTINWHNREITGRVYMRDLLDIAHNNRLTPSINTADTGLDFSVYISNTPVGEKLEKLLHTQKDPRVLYWTPDELTLSEQALLTDFAAYRIMVADYSNRDTTESKSVMDWVQGRLSADIGAFYRLVTESYSRGIIKALDHSNLDFNLAGELPAIFAPLVNQVLDVVYDSSRINFRFVSPFNDLNALNVINGIVREGEFPRGIKPSKEVSASQNFGFDLEIMVHPNDKKLDLRNCRYAKDLIKWIEFKTDNGNSTISADTIYKNFTGINGPDNKNYGLSKRMVQMYLLCLVREGRIRISLSGRNQPVEAVDYTNIASIDFKVATLDAFDQVQMLRPPEGWDVLAPFAAILLDDDLIKNVREDAEIQQAVLRLLDWKNKASDDFAQLWQGINTTLDEFNLRNPLETRMQEWQGFLSARVGSSESIAHLRSGLEKAFGYPVFHNEEVRPEDLDDLITRRNEIYQVTRFFTHDADFRSALRYTEVNLPAGDVFMDLNRVIGECKARLDNLQLWLGNEALLMKEFLTPMKSAIETYRVRYLQLFDQVVAFTENSRQEISNLSSSKEFIALASLGGIIALGEDASLGLNRLFYDLSTRSTLFPASLTRAVVERDLISTPTPVNCPLTLENSRQWLQSADQAVNTCKEALYLALHDKARLLLSAALHERLEQGNEDPFIKGILNCGAVETLADYLADKLSQPESPDFIRALERYLMKINVVKVRLSDFQPSKRTLEKNDLDAISSEFRLYLSSRFDDKEEDGQVTIIEIQ